MTDQLKATWTISDHNLPMTQISAQELIADVIREVQARLEPCISKLLHQTAYGDLDQLADSIKPYLVINRNARRRFYYTMDRKTSRKPVPCPICNSTIEFWNQQDSPALTSYTLFPCCHKIQRRHPKKENL